MTGVQACARPIYGSKTMESKAAQVGVGGIAVSDMGRTHGIPVSAVRNDANPADAVIQVEYFGSTKPSLTLDGKRIVFTEPQGDPDAVSTVAKQSNVFYGYYQECVSEDTTARYAYIVVPYEELPTSGTWDLISDQTIESKLLSIPRTVEMDAVSLTDHGNDTLTATVTAEYAFAGDEVSCYLTKEALSDEVEYVDDGNGGQIAIQVATEPGVLIGSYLVGSGDLNGTDLNFTRTINLTQCTILGEQQDVRTLLETGEYYLRAEVKSGISYAQGMDTAKTIRLVDPLAPNSVNAVTVTAAGNGDFTVTFPKVTPEAAPRDRTTVV